MAAVGLLVIAAIRVLTLVVPVVGPLGDTASDSTVVETACRWSSRCCSPRACAADAGSPGSPGLVLGALYALLGLFVIGAVVFAQVTDQMDQIELVGLAVFVPNAVLWSALLVWLVVGPRRLRGAVAPAPAATAGATPAPAPRWPATRCTATAARRCPG